MRRRFRKVSPIRLPRWEKSRSVNYPRLKSGGLQLAREGCRVWPIDGGPTANVDRRVQVRMGGEPTRDTEETRLRLAIRLLAMPTVATGLARVRWIDEHQRHTRQCRLVGD